MSLPSLDAGDVWLWNIIDSADPVRIRALKGDREHTRHRRKYAEGQLERNDFRRWFRYCIHDDDLAAETELIATQTESTVAESKARILAAIQRNYILLSSSLISVAGAM